jgi:hypothetical protein
VLYRLSLHAQSLFTAAASFWRRDELVLPVGHSAADLVSAALLKLRCFLAAAAEPLIDRDGIAFPHRLLVHLLDRDYVISTSVWPVRSAGSPAIR